MTVSVLPWCQYVSDILTFALSSLHKVLCYVFFQQTQCDAEKLLVLENVTKNFKLDLDTVLLTSGFVLDLALMALGFCLDLILLALLDNT